MSEENKCCCEENTQEHDHEHVHTHTHTHEHTHEDGTTHTHEHTHEHCHTHEHGSGQDHDHCHGDVDHAHAHHAHHDHDHGHSHSHGEGSAPDQVVALLSYMADHNAHHSAELAEMGEKLRTMGKAQAADKIAEGVEAFNQANEKLKEALAMVRQL